MTHTQTAKLQTYGMQLNSTQHAAPSSVFHSYNASHVQSVTHCHQTDQAQQQPLQSHHQHQADDRAEDHPSFGAAHRRFNNLFMGRKWRDEQSRKLSGLQNFVSPLSSRRCVQTGREGENDGRETDRDREGEGIYSVPNWFPLRKGGSGNSEAHTLKLPAMLSPYESTCATTTTTASSTTTAPLVLTTSMPHVCNSFLFSCVYFLRFTELSSTISPSAITRVSASNTSSPSSATICASVQHNGL